MAENVAKAEFLNFMMFSKHAIPKQESPVIMNQVEFLKAPVILKSFNSDFSDEELDKWLSELENILPVDNDQISDLIFCILYNSDLFIKSIRSKDFKYIKVADLYRSKFQENKKYLMEFNKRDQGKINISAPPKIKTRFPPEPSGYLHIGHAKAALLNQLMAKNGEMLIRFDDTNPEKESSIFEQAILEDLKMLKINGCNISRSSDYFDVLYEYAVKLIKLGKAYVDNTPVEQMRKERTDGIESKNRNLDIETNLKIFKEMNEGKSQEYCLRAKISVDNPNKAMRDPVIFRSSDKPHHNTGKKYKIYPTYDFTVPILDSIEGVTLCLRTNEYRDRNPQYYWFIEAFPLENKPKIHDFSRLCFDNTVISKRKMKFYVENNFVSGWDDPRLCTLRGLKKLGMNMDALREYIYLQGASQKTSVNSWDKIWAINKKVIDPISPRFSAVPFKNAVLCIVNGAQNNIIEVPKYKKNLELGNKHLLLSNEILMSQEDAHILQLNEEFTLMNWGNAIIKDKITENNIVTQIVLDLHLEGDFKQTKNKISWIPAKGSSMVKFYEYGNLQNDIETDDLAEQFNKDSKKEEFWLVENSACSLKEGEYVQFERIGFYICDKPYEFNLIPYTKQKRVIE